MIIELIGYLIEALMMCSIVLLVFKYISPREKKELKLQRDKQFREVERLPKKGDKQSITQVIQIFDSLEEVSEKLGDFSLVSELRERSNNLRRQLGLEVKSELGSSAQEVGKFIQQLMKGPYGKGPVIELSPPEAVAPGIEANTSPKSLLDEGAEILARLRSIRGEEAEEKPTVLFPKSQLSPGESTSTPVPIPVEESSSERAPAVIKLPSRVASRKGSVPPPPLKPPRAPPAASSDSNEFSESPPQFIPPPPRPAGIPTKKSSFPPRGTPIEPASSSSQSQFIPPPKTPFKPVAIPIINPPNRRAEESISELERPDEIEEPPILQTSQLSSEPEVPQASDEKNEILARLNQELPLLPENEKYNIVEELMKRPAGKLRETWFKIVVHKNKQYAAEQ